MPLSIPMPERSLWTVADLEQLPDDGNRHEILHGELLLTAMPAVRHQRVARRLNGIFTRWCDSTSGWEYLSPGGVFISETTWLEPDLAVYPVPSGHTIEAWRELPPPVLAVESLSAFTAKTDRHRKRPAYLAHGVAEVWLIDAEARTVERWTAASEFPELHQLSITWAPVDGAPSLVIAEEELFGPPESRSDS